MEKSPLRQVNSVLNKVLSSLGLDRRLREHTFMSLWPTFVSSISSAAAARSRPLFIDAERNLVISVKDAATGQELSMVKGKVLQKVLPAARSLNIDIRGLRLDLKHYHATSTMPFIEEVKPLPKPSEADLSAVDLKPADVAAIEDLRSRLANIPDAGASLQLQEKISALFERELRLRRYRFLHDYPICPQCGNPVERLHDPSVAPVPRTKSGTAPICIACLYGDS